jgi:hypothetical protein
MTNAKIELPNGTKIEIEGSPDDIQRVINAIGKQEENKSIKSDKAPPAEIPKRKEKVGITGLILELKQQGFFKQKRELKEIQEKLESEGYIYPVTTLSPILIRFVKDRELGRIKENGKWKYVNR